MSEHKVTLEWRRDTRQTFPMSPTIGIMYWCLKGGVRIPASSAPAYRGNASRVNPEVALVGALSSRPMLTFLAVAAKKPFVVDQYHDHAIGFLEKTKRESLPSRTGHSHS